MRILLLAHAPSVHTRTWAHGLAARGHEIRLLSAQVGAESPPVPLRRVGWPAPIQALRYAGARGAVREELRRFAPDATVAHFLPNYGFLAALAGAKPWMLVCWGSDLLVNAVRTPLHRARARFTLRSADLIHVDAEMMGQAAARLGADPTRVWVRPWGVGGDAFRPVPPWGERRAQAEELRVLWTRQLETLYDPESFLQGLGLLARRGVLFRTTMAGSGPLAPALARLARREKIENRVHFTGWIDRARLIDLYRVHHVYVSVSRSDSTSQSLLEAMAAGLVPVVTDIAGNREWITHRRNGLLVPPGDAEALALALAEIHREPNAAQELARRARETVERRGRLEEMLSETEERLMALATGRSARPRGQAVLGGAR